MGVIQRKDKKGESAAAMKMFVPSTDDFMSRQTVAFPEMEQFPPSVARQVSVGILSAAEVRFDFDSDFRCVPTGQIVGAGSYVAACSDGKVFWRGTAFDELCFEPVAAQKADELQGHFCLRSVVIGIGFHWERREDQFFKGALKFVVDNDKLVAINVLHIEDYLYSVISSEMSAMSSLELLKAHAVISRSWLVKPIFEAAHNRQKQPRQTTSSAGEWIKWYERDAHALFDVCADDHCQRYQGVGRAHTPLVLQAVEATRGEVLVSGGEICDARFSKSCGGVSERFESCWADEPHTYLQPVRDVVGADMPDLTIEANAERWIRSAPESFCNTHDARILSQVLNNYDQETTDFYRWKVRYTTAELSDLVRRKSGIDFGDITALEPVERGASGRLVRLRIVGTRRTLVVGKELEIRRWLSESHLYSSAFVVDRLPDGFLLTGAGWGHGVGLCQIGAAVMGAKGYKYDEILAHYFIHSQLKKLW